ncbi:BQ5605_C017g08327 [Microbotryum silenes-dioicae]|uniref:BQ5605_C017g08327 protein n=1 Tax=Microbotryum silenes-dioicae TaxID=796604 RepID=A0A2X0LUD7_9BASI|nr:BQ5605_C017g08327 [Microbotryum silenes-dioicae]
MQISGSCSNFVFFGAFRTFVGAEYAPNGSRSALKGVLGPRSTYLSRSVYQVRAFPILRLDPAARPEETSRSLSAASSPKSSTASHDDPAERDPPLPPDDGHEYRPYRVGRTPSLLENINEGNTLPLIVLVFTRHQPLPKTFKDAMASPEAEFVSLDQRSPRTEI